MKPAAPARGRPPKDDDDNAEAFLHIRMRKKDQALWVATSRKEGKKLSQWVTERLERRKE